MHARAVVSRHHAAIAKQWGKCEKIRRIAEIAENVEENEIKRKPDNTFSGEVDVQLRDE